MTPAARQELLLATAKADPEGRIRPADFQGEDWARELRLLVLLGVMYEQEPGVWRLESAQKWQGGVTK